MSQPAVEKKLATTPWSHLGDIDRIVDAGLCTRCGVCAVCPYDAISWDASSYPKIDHDACPECGLCMAVCPGESIDLPKLAETLLTKRKTGPDHPLGTIHHAHIAHANDPEVRENGAGGGIVTQMLADLLESREINGAVVVRASPEHPWQSEPFVATTIEEIKKSAGSRYTMVPLFSLIPKLQKMKGRYAVVALPCQVEGLRLLQKTVPYWANKISLVISLYCGTNWEIEATTELTKNLGVKLDDVTRLEYRGGGWPGEFRVTTRVGEVHSITKLVFNYLRFMYMPDRCTTCVDMAGELSDISIGDAWLKDASGRFQFPACSTVITRTEAGERYLMEAVARGSVSLLPISEEDLIRQHQPGINSKKLIAHQRIKKRTVAPNYGTTAAPVTLKDKMGVFLYGVTLKVFQTSLSRKWLLSLLTTRLGVTLMKGISRLREKLRMSLV